jgi:GTPase SAR1 family protein
MAEVSSKKDLKRKASLEERIIRYLSHRPNESAPRVLVLEEVEGKQERKIEAIQTLIEANVLTMTGQAQNQHNPLWLHLDRNALRLHDFISRFGD